MNHVTFTAALTGATTYPRGTTILNSLNLELPPGRLLTDHATCYPPSEPGTVLEPLYPDRLAEDFLALTMPGHPADYPAQSWAASTATMLLARHGDQRAPAYWTPRAVTFLASAAHRWPHLGLDYLFPLLLDDPQLAVDAGSAAMTAIADLPGTTPAVLGAIEACLPEHRHVHLDSGIAVLTRRLTRHLLDTVGDPAARTRICAVLGWRLSNAGLHDEALAPALEAVQMYRRLAEAEQATFEPELAKALGNLCFLLSKLNEPEEAVALAEEAVHIYRELAAANPAQFEPDLAWALNNLSVGLADLHRRQEALPYAEQAVNIYRLLATEPGFEQADLAWALNNLGLLLAELVRSN